jgi:hypothetical protein
MNLIYYEEEYFKRSGGLIGTLYTEGEYQGVSWVDVIAALEAGEQVSIRVATRYELSLAEARCAILLAATR